MSSASSSSSASASTDWWCGGSGQVKWLTDVVAGGKSNDWLMQWYGNVLCLALAPSLALEIRATWRNFRYLIFILSNWSISVVKIKKSSQFLHWGMIICDQSTYFAKIWNHVHHVPLYRISNIYQFWTLSKIFTKLHRWEELLCIQLFHFCSQISSLCKKSSYDA